MIPIQTTDENRSRCRLLGGLLAAVLLAAPALAEPTARIAIAVGAVELGRGEPPAWSPVGEGDRVAPGEALRTGHDGRAELVWHGATIRLYGDSLLRLPADATGASAPAGDVALDEGTGLFDVKRRSDRPFEVRTPEVVVSVKGTRFGVARDEGPDSVFVTRGSVGVRGLAADREVLVREGFRAMGWSDRPAELFLLEGPDPWKAWGAKASAPRWAAAATAPPAARMQGAQRQLAPEVREEAIGRALERHPELRERLAAMDPAADGRREGIRKRLEPQFIETWLNGGTASAQGGSLFDVMLDPEGELITVLLLSSGQTWTFDDDLLEEVLEGTQSLPIGLTPVLLSAGIAPPVFVQMMLTLLDDD